MKRATAFLLSASMLALFLPSFHAPAWAAESCVPDDANLLAYWKLDDDALSLTAADSSGNGNDGTYVNGPMQSAAVAPTIFDNPFSRNFDSSDDYVDAGDILDLTTNFTASAWVNPDTIGTDRQVVSRGYDGTNTQWELKTTTPGGNVGFRSWQSGAVGVESIATLSSSVWTHLTGTFDGTTWRIYINGALDNSAVAGAPLSVARHVVIGGVDTPTGFRQLWDGLIDDVRVYDRVLTDEEIADLAAGECGGEEEEELTCNGLAVTIEGTDGNEIIKGTNGPDVIHGRGGNDIIKGLSGDDVICGGEGNDIIYADKGNDWVDGDGGNDVIRGGNGEDELHGGMGNDVLRGENDVDALFGEEGNDVLNGGGGTDTLNGGANHDVCHGSSDIEVDCEV